MSRVLVVTGASRGIGLAAASFFAEEGWQVEGVSRGPSTLAHPSYNHSSVDLTNSAAVKEWSRRLRVRCQSIDGLICAAGKMPAGSLGLSTSQADLTNVFELNVVTVLNVCREITPLMIPRRSGRIVCISSIMTALHARGTLSYSAMKSGVTEMAKVLARELAPLGITCNVMAPGYVATESAVALGEDVVKAIISQQTLQRPITTAEVCHTLRFLLSAESSAVTGQVVYLGLVT